MTWHGYNYEDAVIMSERMVKDDVYTSIHIEEYTIERRKTKLGEEGGRQQRAYRAGFGTASEEQRHQGGKGVGAVGDIALWRRRAG